VAGLLEELGFGGGEGLGATRAVFGERVVGVVFGQAEPLGSTAVGLLHDSIGLGRGKLYIYGHLVSNLGFRRPGPSSEYFNVAGVVGNRM